MTVGSTCVQCGAAFTPWPSNPKQRHCSRKCAGLSLRAGPPTYRCEQCGKITPRRPFKLADGRTSGYDYGQRFCSPECGYKGRSTKPVSLIGWVHSSGYRRMQLKGGKKAFQHRMVMEQMVGRPLRKGENVHHMNGDRLDNRPENLELWVKHQPPGQRVIDKVDFAIEMLQLYPEFAERRGFRLVQLGGTEAHPTDEPPDDRSVLSPPAN